ncbi:helix-turn-helix transcriptional regulator [Providencia sp. Me31A]|uniref:helix-turn-helix transcriptional regulator n=1 Tax=Providencia sp. Me31A TaxID=3392637 RepID=UPI003D2AC3A0
MNAVKKRNENLGNHIKELRIVRNIPVKVMADKLNIHEKCYIAYECGETSIYADHLMVISKILGVNINKLINFYLNT